MDTERFIVRWGHLEGGRERANYALFLTELTQALDLPPPNPADGVGRGAAYEFEYPVRGDASAPMRIDLYKQDAFILEAKQSRWRDGKNEIKGQENLFPPDGETTDPRDRRWDVLMRNAFNQAWDYANRLPADHDRPPFLLVCDVGRGIDVYADFTGQGRNYRPFPDPRSKHIALEDLKDPAIAARLRAIWTDPRSLDPAAARAKATREIAGHLAQVSRSLEEDGAPPEEAATFLMRCLFAMFAEDIGLLPSDSFMGMLRRAEANPDSFMALAEQLFEAMDEGRFAFGLEAQVRRFNGAFYKNRRAFPLKREAIGALIEAARTEWRDVEPAIFGTLLEQALSKAERSRLGAHYTPRPYVERLVTATVIEPLRRDWEAVQGAAEQAKAEGDLAGARRAVAAFHEKLTLTRVLDPACGTGNFLYVTLELMKALEAEVLDGLAGLSADAGGAAELIRRDIDPSQFWGLELNPRAAAITELVLWIGYLQTLSRQGLGSERDPVLQDFRTINPPAYRRRPDEASIDAVLAHDGPIVGGGGTTYPNPRRPAWPEAEFIVGNPPFIGGKDIRGEQGDAYAEALWKAHPAMNDSADLVMYWWDRAADILTRKGSKLRRFGFVTTNSITQVFQRRVVQRWMAAKSPLSLVFAVDDHPWTKATKDAAAVRIAMTVAEAGSHDGALLTVTREAALETDQPEVEARAAFGKINADITMGVDVTKATPLLANAGLSSPGMKLHGAGFILSLHEAEHLGLGRAERPGLEDHIRPYLNGRDLTGRSRSKLVVDFFGLTAEEVRRRYPEVYQHLGDTVKADRASQAAKSPTRDAQEYLDRWWLFGKPRQELRPALAGIRRYIATIETAKHRIFQFLDGGVLPDNMLVVVASEDASHLAMLSSRIHVDWMLGQGGTLEDRPRYTKSRCFDPYPFPEMSAAQRAALAEAGERLDAFRKARLAEQPQLTLTRLYNALEARRERARSGRPMTAQEAADDAAGSVLVLQELHEEIDRLTLEAYGWPADLGVEEILARLVALNAERAAEEARGLVRWLRPDYQRPRARGQVAGPAQPMLIEGGAPRLPAARPAFPADRTGQHAAILASLAAAPRPLTAVDIAARYKGRRVVERVDGALRALARLGHARPHDEGRAFTLRRAA